MLMTPAPRPRCGLLVTGAVYCPASRTQVGDIIHNHPTLRVAVRMGLLGQPALHSMESGISHTLCLSGGRTMCPGRVLREYF